MTRFGETWKAAVRRMLGEGPEAPSGSGVEPMGWTGPEALETQRQTFRNDTSADIEMWVEAEGQHYILKPGDEMVIEAEIPRQGSTVFEVVVTKSGLRIYPVIGVPERVWINGEPAVEISEGAA